jgi:hypothetical protein
MIVSQSPDNALNDVGYTQYVFGTFPFGVSSKYVNAAWMEAKLNVFIPKLQNESADPGDEPVAKYNDFGTIVLNEFNETIV